MWAIFHWAIIRFNVECVQPSWIYSCLFSIPLDDNWIEWAKLNMFIIFFLFHARIGMHASTAWMTLFISNYVRSRQFFHSLCLWHHQYIHAVDACIPLSQILWLAQVLMTIIRRKRMRWIHHASRAIGECGCYTFVRPRAVSWTKATDAWPSHYRTSCSILWMRVFVFD